MSGRIHINGKWLSQAMTGTQRYANEIVKAIVAADRFDLVVHVPAGTVIPDWLQRGRITCVPRRSKAFCSNRSTCRSPAPENSC